MSGRNCAHIVRNAKLEAEIDTDAESFIGAGERVRAGESSRLRKLSSHRALRHGIDERRDVAIVRRNLVISLIIRLEIRHIDFHLVRNPDACATADGIRAGGETDVVHVVVSELIVSALDADTEHERFADIILGPARYSLVPPFNFFWASP